MDLPPSNEEWHLVRDGKPYGPFSPLEFLKFIELGHLKPNDLLWRDGFNEWRSATVVFPELQEFPSPTHVEPVDCTIEVGEPLAVARPVECRATSRKSLVLTFFLIVLLGGAVSYGYFSSDWPLSEFLAQFLAL